MILFFLSLYVYMYMLYIGSFYSDVFLYDIWEKVFNVVYTLLYTEIAPPTQI